MLLKFFGVAAGAAKGENIYAPQIGIHFLKRAGFYQRIDTFARAVGEVVSAVHANLEIVIQVFIVEEFTAFGALGPETLRDIQTWGANRWDF
jgi:hypothetical protein